MKQTAVEWLVEQMFKQGYFDGNKPLTFTNLDHLQQQAKEIEKQQQDKFAIEFGKWLENLTEDFYSKNDECSYSELLEIFKKDKL